MTSSLQARSVSERLAETCFVTRRHTNVVTGCHAHALGAGMSLLANVRLVREPKTRPREARGRATRSMMRQGALAGVVVVCQETWACTDSPVPRPGLVWPVPGTRLVHGDRWRTPMSITGLVGEVGALSRAESASWLFGILRPGARSQGLATDDATMPRIPALVIVSAHSLSGSESATMPAPTL